ncbi:kinesin-1 [Heterostelium album PN500]|uniref:Kinesin-like protein n=1 Tax=Heterostelium pallidum (strain ATCC 26659 / Pp 5 / PN500) TaxID=670386 RepID=D3BDQ8_HETP5|nr:kinesin-1 [Heterostelium album PN500]EFA80039.1 kinesin-1 [Heterostelium album PN500]|eukprot:XP_020432159.1 kinesin-1 [Heterostelium album PN500]
MATSCNIRVIARFRPLNAREKSGDQDQVVVQFPGEGTQLIMNQGGNQVPFTFDRVFPPDTHQEEIFEIVKSTVDDVLNGYNGTIFAYGQTGSGKTFTMFGSEDKDPELAGIIPRTNVHIFNKIAEDTSGSEFTIKCSFVEIYMEIIKDLLNPKNTNLKIRESKANGIWIEGLTEEFVADEHEIMDLIALGEQSRSVSKTNMNQRSSRSHSLLILTIEQKSKDGSIKRGKLNLVDLAGSEKVAKTGAEGQTLEEAKKINQSLSLLGNCIHALTESKREHIPFRDSKLTRILQESLGGNTKTTLMITASPHVSNVEETISTLKFGSRAKTIKNTVKVNSQKSAAELLAIIGVLTKELSSLKHYSLSLEKLVEYMKSPEYIPGSPIPEQLLCLAAPPPPAATSPTTTATSNNNTSTPSKASNRHSTALTSSPVSSPAGSASHRHSVALSTPLVNSLAAASAGVANGSGGRTSPSSENGTPSLYDPMAMVELTMQIDRIKEENQQLVDKFKDELSEITMQYESTKEELQQVRSQLEVTKESMRNADQESKSYKDAERSLKVEVENRELRITSLSQQVDDLRILASQVIHRLKYCEVEQENKDLSKRLQSMVENERIRLTAAVGSPQRARKSISTNGITSPNLSSQQSTPNTHIPDESITSISNNTTTDTTTSDSTANQEDEESEEFNELRIQLEQSESEKKSLNEYNLQLQSEASDMKSQEFKLLQEIKVLKSNGDLQLQEHLLFKEDVAMKSKLQQTQITNLQSELQSLQNKLNQEKQYKQKAQNQQIEISSKSNEIVKKLEEQNQSLQLQVDKQVCENEDLQQQYSQLMEKCQDLQNELTTAQRLLMNRRAVKVVRSDEKSMKRAYEIKLDFGQQFLKKTGKKLY